MLHLAADFGTSSVKGGVFDDNGTYVEGFHQPLPLSCDSFSPDYWLSAFKSGIASLSDCKQISTVTLSGNGPTVVPVFSDTEWGDAVLWFQDTPGKVPGGKSYFLPKMCHIKEHRPQDYEKTGVFLTCPGFISWLLTGERRAVSPNSEFIPHFWTKEEAAVAGIDSARLPAIAFSGDMIGRVSERGSRLFGLNTGTQVFGGGLDYLMALLGTRTVSPGDSCDRAGTSEGINYCSATRNEHPSLRQLPHIIMGSYHVSGILNSTGRVFEWFRELTGQTSVSYTGMMERISSVDSAAMLPRFFPSARHGKFWEFSSGIFSGLSPRHTAADLGKAVVEAIAFGIRDVLSVLDSAGCTVSALNGSGGQMRNHIWTQMKADITGVAIRVPHVIDAELSGCICCAFTGLGRFANLREAALGLVAFEKVYEPDRSKLDMYTRNYQNYCYERDRMLGREGLLPAEDK